MPRLLEADAEFLTLNYDTLAPDKQAEAKDWLQRYKQQQADEGEPLFPSVVTRQVEQENNLRRMFEAPDKIDYDPGYTSADPLHDKMQHANMALLSARYQKEPAEVASRYDFLLNDYARQKLGASEDVDTAKFYALAQKDMQKVKLREDTKREGMSAALRGEDGVKALAAWQAKNADRAKDDAGLFMRGYQQAIEQDGEMLPIADRLLPLLEASASKKEGQAFDQTKAQELGGIIEQLAGMKKAQRKSVYRSIAARIEAAGYDQKGFWSQMLGELDKGLYRMVGTLGTSAGIASDVATAVAGAQTRIPDTFDGSSVSMPVLSDEEQQALLRQRDYRERIGNVQEEIMQIVSGELDPVRPTLGWLNDTIETGAIKGPGAVAPFMAASALLGPYGAGLVFTADFAEQNRRELVQSGLDADQARKVGAMAAPLQAAVESLSNMVSLGKFPAVQSVLSRFTRPVGGASLVGRYVQNSLISLATEFTEEQVQDNVVVPAMQELLGALEKDVPEVDWSFYKTRAANATPELAATLLPMALVFGGVMTAADARLSDRMTSNVDALTALNYSQAQATEIVQEKTPEARIAKAASLWRSREGNKTSLEQGAAKLAERLKALSGDAVAYQAELERRGVLPRVMHTAENDWLLTFNDGSTARFATHDEASTARWTWAEDQLGRVHALTREALTSMERNMSTNRELGVEFKPDVRMVEAGQTTPDIQRRVEQGKVLGDIDPNEAFDTASMVDRATAEADGFLSSYQILGSSRNEFKDGVLHTTIKLWEGSNVLTLVEEKLEGDAQAIVASRGGRGWMLAALRNYEQESGDKLFRDVPDDQLTDDDLVEAWSHLGQSYLVGRSSFGEPLQQNNMRRFSRLLMRAGLAGALNSESTFWQAVVNRAQKLGELKAAGKLGADVVAELEKQLGIDSQVKHEQEAMQEAQNVANEVAQQVDTSGYSEETPGPNGETFSLAKWSKNDNLSNGFLGTTSWQSFRDSIENIDPSAKGGVSSRVTSAGTKDAELTSLWRSGFTAVPNTKEDARGGEHVIEFRNGRAYKQTHPETFGAKFSPETPGSLVWGTPLEYLQRWRLFNEIFDGADVKFEGVVMHPNGALSLKISQPIIEGPHPSIEHIQEALKKAGWKNIALNTWEKTTSRGTLLMTDAKPENFKVSNGTVVPVDVIVSLPTSPRAIPADASKVETFSLRPGDFASRVEAMFSPFQRSPEARLVMARVAKDRALRVMPQLLELQAQFNDINRQRQDLETKFAEESAQLRADLEADEQQVRQERDFELKGVSQDKGSELDRERIRRDADNKLSRLRLEYERSIRELEKRKETETAKLARKDNSAQREKTRQLLKLHDAILAAVPAKIRPSIGGFASVVKFTSNEQALEFLQKRMTRIDSVVEKYLITEARGQLERVFDKARPKSDAGEKAKGKLTPELHAWFKLAEEATKLSPAVADERIQGIEQSLASDMTDAIKQELSDWLGRPVTDDAEAQTWQETRLTLFQTFGAVMYGTDAKSERNAAEITAALDAAREAYQTGRLAHIEQLAKLREKRAEERGDGIQRVGSPYDPNKANTRKKALNKATGLKGRALDYMDTGLDASGFLLDLLGDDTETDLYETTRRNLLEAAATKADNMEKRKADFAAMLKQVFPGKGLVDRLRGLWELQQIQENAPVGTMSQLQAMQFTLWHLDPDSREWLATNGYGDEWQAKAEQWLTSEAKAVRAWLLKQYDGQYDRLNPVFRRLRGVNLPRVEVYGGKRQIEHSKSDSTASIEADMMRGGMDAGFTKTRVSRPTGRPRMTDALQNYWQNALQVEHYIAFAETVTELKAVFGHRDFLGAVETNRGLAKKQQVLDWISNIETAGTRDAFAHSMQGKLFGRYGKAVSASALLFKLATLAKQAPAAIQSAFKVGLKEYFTSLSRIMAGKGAISLGDMYRSDTVQRRLSEHDNEMLQASKGWNQRHFDNEILDKAAIAPEVMMNAGWYALGWTDARFTTISAAVAYDVAYRMYKRLNTGSSEEEAKAFAADEAALVVMETAQPQDVVTKSLSENMMPQALLRLVFAFQSANRQIFGLTYLAAKQGKVANAYAVAAIIAAMTQTIGGIMRMLFSDDDPEELFDPQAYALGMATAPLTGMVGFGPLVEFVLNFAGVESRFSPSSAAAAKSLQDIVNGEADTKDVGRVVSMAGAALGGRGAMLSVGWNVLNQIMGLYENAADQ